VRFALLCMGGDLLESERSHFAPSVEVRREVGETYSPLKGVYRNYELTHVIGDERDLIGVRTGHRHLPLPRQFNDKPAGVRVSAVPNATNLLLNNYRSLATSIAIGIIFLNSESLASFTAGDV